MISGGNLFSGGSKNNAYVIPGLETTKSSNTKLIILPLFGILGSFESLRICSILNKGSNIFVISNRIRKLFHETVPSGVFRVAYMVARKSYIANGNKLKLPS